MFLSILKCPTFHCHKSFFQVFFNCFVNSKQWSIINRVMFVPFRSASPYHGFTIMNRLSTVNLVEPINKDLEFQLQDPFLLYKNGNCKWFE